MKPYSLIMREHKFLSEQLNQLKKTQTLFISASVFVFVVAMSIYVGVQNDWLEIPDTYLIIFLKLSYSVFIFITANIIAKFTTPLLNRSTKFLDITSRRTLIKVWNYFIWLSAFLVIISDYFGSLKSLGLSIGLVSAGLAIALQQPITSIVSWMVINAKRVYRIGDRIVVKDLKGDVVDITMFHTVLREFGRGFEGDDPTGVLVTIPNNIILTEAVYNYTQEFPFVWDEIPVSITYESDFDLAQELVSKAAQSVVGESMEKAVTRMRFYLRDSPQEDSLSPEPLIYTGLADSSIRFTVRYITDARKKRKTKSEIAHAVLELVNSPKYSGRVHIAYPHMQIVVPKD